MIFKKVNLLLFLQLHSILISDNKNIECLREESGVPLKKNSKKKNNETIWISVLIFENLNFMFFINHILNSINYIKLFFLDLAHSSVERAGLLGGVKFRLLETDSKHRLRGEALEEAIRQDKEKGLIPFYVSQLLQK